MPGYILHKGATVLCMHAGQGQPAMSNPRVKISGQPIVTQACPYIIAGCTLANTLGTSCVTAQWVSAATRLRADGLPILLKDSQAVCAPTGTGLNIVLTQMRVKGI